MAHSIRPLWIRLLSRSSESGFTIVEICVAMMVMSIALIGVVGSMGAGFSLVGQGRQRSSGASVAQQAIERVRNVPYAQVALDSVPVHSLDLTNPDYNATSVTYDEDGSGSRPPEPLVIDVTNGAIPHIEDPVTVGTTAFNIYQYVTWVDDPNIVGTAQDYKRVVVVVTWKTPVRQGGINHVTQTTLVSSGVVNVGATTVTPPPVGATTHLAINMPAAATTGLAVPVTVTAQDANNLTVSSYTAAIRFTSSDTAATLPDIYTFTATDAGSHQFSVTFNTAGSQTLQIADSTRAVTGSSSTSVSAPSLCPGDTSPPVGTEQLISGSGALTGYTTSTTVQVKLTATDPCTPITAELSNDNVTWGPTQALSNGVTNIFWGIAPGDGSKTIYARFRDAAGHLSTSSSATIVLDHTFPLAPTNVGRGLVSCSGSTRTVTLIWTPPLTLDANFLGYSLYKSVDDGAYTRVATFGAATGIDTDDSKNETSARYVVRTYDKAGNESADQATPFTLSKNQCS